MNKRAGNNTAGDPAKPVADTVTLRDPQAFEAVVRKHDRDLRLLASRIVGWPATDDVLQEAYLKAYRALPSYRDQRNDDMRAWLCRIVYSCCIDWLRRSRRAASEPLDNADALASDSSPDEQVASADGVSRALALLPTDERAAVICVDALGFDYGAASAILGVPAGTIASRLHRARSSIRRVIEAARREEAEAHGKL
jgi:RNA polymerase sigma-70 factor, ECF subfamily